MELTTTILRGRQILALLMIISYPLLIEGLISNAIFVQPSSFPLLLVSPSSSSVRSGSSNRFLWNHGEENSNKLDGDHRHFSSNLFRSPLIKSPSRAHTNLLSLSLSSSNEENEKEGEELTPEKIVELVEVSFIKACMQLSQGYVDVLKLFIVAVKAAYENDMPASELIHSVRYNCPVNTAGRDLLPEEIQLRSTWIYATYLLLGYLEYEVKKKSGVDPTQKEREEEELRAQVQEQYSDMFPVIERLHSSQGTFADVLKQSETVLDYPEGVMDKAILSQTLRVLWYTITVIKEEDLADVNTPPRPNIPGI